MEIKGCIYGGSQEKRWWREGNIYFLGVLHNNFSIGCLFVIYCEKGEREIERDYEEYIK